MVKITDFPDLLREVRTATAMYQPELFIEARKSQIVISGPFVLSSKDGPFDTYDIQIIVEHGFPVIQPTLFETGGKIPRIIDRHIFPRDGSCCVGVWDEWLFRPDPLTFTEYISIIVHDYFVSQTYFSAKGSWPFGERSHGLEGIMESYSEMLGVECNLNFIRGYVVLLCQKEVKGHARCPCGSGKRVRDCHHSSIARLRQKFDRSTSKRMLLTLTS